MLELQPSDTYVETRLLNITWSNCLLKHKDQHFQQDSEARNIISKMHKYARAGNLDILQGENILTDVNCEMIDMLELPNKDFKVAIINMIQEVR